MTYDPRKDLESCLDGTVEASINASTVLGWFVEQDEMVLQAEGGRFGVAGSFTTFDYYSHMLPFRPSSSDSITINNKLYPINKVMILGGGLTTKLTLGFGQNV
jgi:hypothetical protein